jgi:hypothetical protein
MLTWLSDLTDLLKENKNECLKTNGLNVQLEKLGKEC